MPPQLFLEMPHIEHVETEKCGSAGNHSSKALCVWVIKHFRPCHTSAEELLQERTLCHIIAQTIILTTDSFSIDLHCTVSLQDLLYKWGQLHPYFSQKCLMKWDQKIMTSNEMNDISLSHLLFTKNHNLSLILWRKWMNKHFFSNHLQHHEVT